MLEFELPALHIAHLRISIPIIQSGMGVRVSGARLAAAVANAGCAGTIASVGLGAFEHAPGSQFVKLNDDALRTEIRKARSLSSGVIGVNVMVALSNFENLVRVAVEEGVDYISSGAGLPLDLPKLVGDARVALIPIVSSARALRVICTRWMHTHKRLPDAVIVEGPRAGGHLGFKPDELTEPAHALEQIVSQTVEFTQTMDKPIPVIGAGGVFDGGDIVRMLRAGASGVQMATRFVCTEECDADSRFKQAYINATEDDIAVIHSPVGMPGRVIRNAFVNRLTEGVSVPFRCDYRCLRSCDRNTAPFCIAKVLADAAKGNFEQAFAFAGANAARCTEILSVKELVQKLIQEARVSMANLQPQTCLQG